MSIILKTKTLGLRENGEQEFTTVDVLAEKKTSEVLADIEAKADEILEKIPDYDTEITDIKEDLSTLEGAKIDKPSDSPAVGKVLKIKQVNEDGTFVCEWADASSGNVKIDGVETDDNNIPYATAEIYGLVRVGMGLIIDGNKKISIWTAPDTAFKKGNDIGGYVSTYKQHLSAFYGLAKAAGYDEKDSTLPLGTYTDEAKQAIQQMIGIYPMSEEGY